MKEWCYRSCHTSYSDPYLLIITLFGADVANLYRDLILRSDSKPSALKATVDPIGFNLSSPNTRQDEGRSPFLLPWLKGAGSEYGLGILV